MKLRLLLLSLPLTACGMMHDNAPSQAQSAPTPPSLVASNVSGAIVSYSGGTDYLRDADMIARHTCERYNRGAALVNDIPTPGGQSFAYYYCQ